MTGLTDADRETLLAPCTCGHTINDHGTLCWLCVDDEAQTPCQVGVEELLVERLAVVKRDAVAEALTLARAEIDRRDEQAAADNRRSLIGRLLRPTIAVIYDDCRRILAEVGVASEGGSR